jgi:hypothetical protein
MGLCKEVLRLYENPGQCKRPGADGSGASFLKDVVYFDRSHAIAMLAPGIAATTSALSTLKACLLASL